MPKLKSHRGACKRFRKTASGAIKRRGAYRNHILTKKSTKHAALVWVHGGGFVLGEEAPLAVVEARLQPVAETGLPRVAGVGVARERTQSLGGLAEVVEHHPGSDHVDPPPEIGRAHV